MANLGHDRAMVSCDLTAIAPGEREAHEALARQLFATDAQEKRELPEGYLLRFDGGRFDDIVRFVANERRCCPFWSFGIEVTPEKGPVWLRITGPAGAKEILK